METYPTQADHPVETDQTAPRFHRDRAFRATFIAASIGVEVIWLAAVVYLLVHVLI